MLRQVVRHQGAALAGSVAERRAHLPVGPKTRQGWRHAQAAARAAGVWARWAARRGMRRRARLTLAHREAVVAGRERAMRWGPLEGVVAKRRVR